MKKLSLFIFASVLAFSITACNKKNSVQSGPVIPVYVPPVQTAVNDNNFPYGQDFVRNNMPDEYLIAYDVVYYERGVLRESSMEQIVTADGYYLGIDEKGTLYKKRGDNYDLYSTDGGSFVDTGRVYSKEAVELDMFGIYGYMATYDNFKSSLKEAGSEVLLGRECVIYSFEQSNPVIGFKSIYTYHIDIETGICLRFVTEVEGTTKIGYELESTKFQTSGVKLPG